MIGERRHPLKVPGHVAGYRGSWMCSCGEVCPISQRKDWPSDFIWQRKHKEAVVAKREERKASA